MALMSLIRAQNSCAAVAPSRWQVHKPDAASSSGPAPHRSRDGPGPEDPEGAGAAGGADAFHHPEAAAVLEPQPGGYTESVYY